MSLLIDALPASTFNRVSIHRIVYYFALHALFAAFTTLSLFTSTPLCSFFAAIGLVYFATLRQPYHTLLLSLVTYFSFVLISSSYWLAYCLFDFLQIHNVIAVALLLFLFVCLSLILSIPAAVYQYLTSLHSHTFSFSLLFIVFEYLRMQTFLASPWLNSANSAYNISLFRHLLPIGGIYLTGYVFLRFAEAVIRILHGRYDKDARSLLILCLATSCYQLISPFYETSNPQDQLSVRLLQANHNHLLPRDPQRDWQDYINLLDMSSADEFTLFPEGSISFSQDDMSLSEFSKYYFLKNSAVALNYRGNGFFTPMLVGTNDVHGTYQKQRLVPFGEYLPFTDLFGAYVSFFRSHQSAQTSSSTELFRYHDFSFQPLICYDLFFTSHAKRHMRLADAIIVSAENTFYRDSVFQAMFIRAAQIRAYESQTPVLLAMNRGYTSHISSSGDLIGQLPYDHQGVLSSKITKKSQSFSPPYLFLDDLTVLFLLFLFESCHLLYLRYLRVRQSIIKGE